MKKIKRKPLSVVLVRAMGASVAMSVFVTASHAQQAQRVEKIEVTGSNIKRTDVEGPAPIVVIDREAIERSGKTTLTEVLTTMPMASGGTFSETVNAGNSFAPGTAAISLRGLGTNTVLVLLNGRRVAGYGFAQNINEAFVDLNSIPLTAIERIEILKDGASAVYGSDAIAGVINVILRKDFKGLEVGGMWGTTKDGGGTEWRVNTTAGWGDLARNRFNLLVSADYYKREEIRGGDREFSRSANQAPNGGFDQRSPTGNPGTWVRSGEFIPFANCPAERITSEILGVPVCAFDFATNNWLLPKTERMGVYSRGVFGITPHITAFAEAGFTKNVTNQSAAATPGSFAAPAANPSNPFGQSVTAIYRTLDIGLRLNEIESENTRLVGGLKGSGAGWDWETAASYSKNEVTNVGTNYVDIRNIRSAIAGTLAGFVGTYYDLVNNANNSPALLDAIRVTPKREGKSQVRAVDAKGSRELFRMSGGAAAIAVGAEYREEEIADTPDALSRLGVIVGSGGTSSKGERDSSSIYAELALPLFRSFESQLALRHDRYSDFGNTTNPKVAVSYRPAENVLIRGGWGTGFRAPSLVELYLGESIAFNNIRDTTRCNAYRAAFGTADSRTTGVCAAPQVRVAFGGNPTLDAEESRNISLGLVVDITNNFSVSVDYYNITHDNIVTSPTAAFIIANPGLFPVDAIRRTPPTANDVLAGAPGALLGTAATDPNVPGILRSFFNAREQRTSGYDVEARYRFAVTDAGRFTAGIYATYIDTLKRQLNPGSALTELAGTWEIPRVRSQATLNWTTGPWSTTLAGNYRRHFEQFFQEQLERVGSYVTYDLNVQYTGIRNVTLAAGGTNILNREPPFGDLQWSGYADGIDSPRGGFYYVSARYKFR